MINFDSQLNNLGKSIAEFENKNISPEEFSTIQKKLSSLAKDILSHYDPDAQTKCAKLTKKLISLKSKIIPSLPSETNKYTVGNAEVTDFTNNKAKIISKSPDEYELRINKKIQ